MKNTQAILRNLARVSSELTELLDIHFQGSVNRGSRMALRLMLAYHHVSYDKESGIVISHLSRLNIPSALC